MLQQTTVAVAAPRYEAFLALFPTATALADAEEPAVLAAWSGLGYYHRARNLHRGARHLALHHGGQFPRTLEEALAVPGVGPYTARAVLSIAHGVAAAVVDGNVRRVLARVHARAEASGRDWQQLADGALDHARPGDWNQALMELGATVCTPRAPRCPECPLAAGCAARAAGTPEAWPAPPRRRATVDVAVSLAVVEEDGRLLLVQRAPGPLMGGMWELPQTGLDGGADLVAELAERHGLRLSHLQPLGEVRHAITFRRIRVAVCRARLAAPLPAGPFRWTARADLPGIALSSLTKKALALAPARA